MKEKIKSKKLFYIVNIFIILFIFILTIFKIIEENGVETFSYVKNIDFISMIILTSIFFINDYAEGVIIAISMKEYEKDFTPTKGFIIQSIGGLFSAITPLKVGYLPSIGYAYSRFDVKPESVIKSMAKTTYTYQVWCVILSIISYIVCCNKTMIVDLAGYNLDLKYVALIGLIYNCFLLLGYFILVLSPFIHSIVINIMGWLLYKLKKIDDKENYKKEKELKMSIIRKEIIHYFKNIKEFIKIFLIYIFKTVFYGALPYVVYLLISKETFQIELWLYTIVIRTLITYITNIIPIPGASGTAEVIFIVLFSLIYFPNEMLNSVMLVWRFFSYFISIIIGMIVFIIMINISKKSKNKLTQ